MLLLYVVIKSWCKLLEDGNNAKHVEAK